MCFNDENRLELSQACKVDIEEVATLEVKNCADNEEFQIEALMWLKQQPKEESYTAATGALIKQ